MQLQKRRRRGFGMSSGAGLAAWAFVVAGCSPTFDWRDVRPEGAGLVASFPCRPDRHERNVAVGGATVSMRMLVCSTGGATYALSFYDAPDAATAAAGLEGLKTGMLANIHAGPPRDRPFRIAGLDGTAAGSRISADGLRPDGSVLRLEAAFFAKDLRVFQAAVVGPPLTDDAVDPFFDGLVRQE